MDYEKLIAYQAQKICEMEQELKWTKEYLYTIQQLYLKETKKDTKLDGQLSDPGIALCQTTDSN